jgi:hypothetical protein
MYGHVGSYTEPRTYAEEPSRTEQALWFAGHDDPEHAASLVHQGDAFALRHLTEDEWAALRPHLLRRGMVMVVGDGEGFVDYVAVCIWCREPHAADDPHAACAGPVPLNDVDDDDTAEVCVLCLRAVNGPPTFCCNGREKLYAALHANTPIRQCRVCKGIGVLSHGLPCNLCSGTGVAGVL